MTLSPLRVNKTDFGIMPFLVAVVKILKKNWGHRENLGENGGQTFKGSDREKCELEYFGNFQHQAFANFW